MAGAYLKKSRHGTMFFFRRRVPDDLRTWIGKPYLTKSLGTGNRRQAIIFARVLAAKTDNLFYQFRAMRDDDRRTESNRFEYSFSIDLKEWNVSIEDAKPEDQDAINSHIATLLQNLPVAALPSGVQSHTHDKKPVSGITINEAWLGYKSEQISLGQRKDMKGGWSDGEDTATYDYFPHIKAFIDLIGDKPIAAVTAEEVLRFRQFVMNDENGGAANNRKKRLVRAGAVFRWAKKNLHITDNFSEQFLFQGVVEKNPYVKFEQSDLVALFQSSYYRECQFKAPFEYWLPVLALHTGARLNELCQLTVSDIGMHEGIDTISILDEDFGKRLKNRSSRRIVPIHSQLVRLGFLNYVATIPSGRIFPELRENPSRLGDYSAQGTEFFTDYRRSVGVGAQMGEGKSRKAFHSFRSTLIGALRKANVPKDRRTRLAGHEYTDTQDGTYDGGDVLTMFDFATLKADIELVKFDVDFTPYRAAGSVRNGLKGA